MEEHLDATVTNTEDPSFPVLLCPVRHRLSGLVGVMVVVLTIWVLCVPLLTPLLCGSGIMSHRGSGA